MITEKPEDGCYAYGMFLEGARWDSINHMIVHSKPKELFSDFPSIHIMPVLDRIVKVENTYLVPIYKVIL